MFDRSSSLYMIHCNMLCGMFGSVSGNGIFHRFHFWLVVFNPTYKYQSVRFSKDYHPIVTMVYKQTYNWGGTTLYGLIKIRKRRTCVDHPTLGFQRDPKLPPLE